MNKNNITIGITAYNEGNLLKDAWESIESQTRTDWIATMILDGGSDQKTEAVFDKIYHPSLTKIKLSNNNGPYYCRTLAIEKSTTDWYCHLDADDRFPPATVEIINNIIDEDDSLMYIIGCCLYFNKNRYEVKSHNGITDKRLAYTLPFNGQSPIKKELFNKLNGYCKDLYKGGADWDFWLKVIESNVKGKNIDEIIYERRIRKNSVGSNWSQKRYEITEMLIDSHPQYFNSQERKNIARFKMHEIMARNYRTHGNRKDAYLHAKKSLKYSSPTPTLDEIIREYDMSIPRYILRRIGRLID